MGKLKLKSKHRLLCGDSTSEDDVARLMDGEKADLCFTDPPYGVKRDVGFGGFGGFGKPIARRKYEGGWDNERPSKSTFDLVLNQATNSLIFGGNYFADILPQGNHWVVWDKKNTMPTFGDCELVWTNIEKNSVKIKVHEYNGLIGKEKERFHPTQKPVALIVYFIEEYNQGGSIFDPFMGSGTTLIACEQMNRQCYGMEIDPLYCDVIVKRWENLTNKKAVLSNG